MELNEIMEEMEILSGLGKDSLFHTAKARAFKEAQLEKEQHMLQHIKALISREHLAKGIGRAEIMGRADERIEKQIDTIYMAKLEAGIAQATHQQKTARLNALSQFLIAEQSLMKNLK